MPGRMAPKALMRALGVLGLVPFFAAALGVMFLDELLHALSQRAFLVYSLAILCFLAGTLWGEVLGSSGSTAASVLVSNGVVLFAVSATLTAQPLVAALLLMLGHIAQLWYEANLTWRARWYTRMRGWLSGGAVLAHLMFVVGLIYRA